MSELRVLGPCWQADVQVKSAKRYYTAVCCVALRVIRRDKGREIREVKVSRSRFGTFRFEDEDYGV